MKKVDMLIILIVLILSGSYMLYVKHYLKDDTNVLKAEIQVNGKPYKTVHLEGKEQIITIENEHGKNVLKVHDGGIEMIEADCPDQVCTGMGFVNKTGGIIVCLPHKLAVEIKGEQKEEIDGVSR